MSTKPKPLSEKTINRMLEGWNPKTVSLIHRLYASLANLYGVISLKDAWYILKQTDIKLKKRDFIEFSNIARREDLPYYIFEIDEMYSGEQRSIEERMIVHKAIYPMPFSTDYGIYVLDEAQTQKPPYIPKDIFVFAEQDGVEQNPHWKELCNFVSNLKSNDGCLLTEYCHFSREDEFEIGYYKNEAKQKKIYDHLNRPISVRILERLKHWILMGSDFTKYLMLDFESHSIALSEKEVERLMQLLSAVNNSSNLWINFGWSPSDMMKAFPQKGPTVITLGSGIKKAIADGDINLEELEREMKKLGVTLLTDLE